MSSQNSSRLIEEQVSEQGSESNNDTTTASTIMNNAAFFEGESAVKLKKKKKDDKLSSSATKISKDKIDNSPQTSTSASNNETITSVSKNKCYGVLNDMFKINLVPNLSLKSSSSNTATTYTHRLSYNTRNNAYYENRNLDDIYIRGWERGAFKAVNMCRKEENDWKMQSANIIWKFDYRPSKLVINSISLKLRFATFDETASVKWMIQLTPTRSNPNTDWILLDYSDNTNNNIYWERNDNDGRKDLTALRALLSGGTTHYCWQKTQLFRQALTSPNKDDPNSRNGMADDDESFGLDVKVELKPQFICELPLNNNNNTIPSYSSPLQNNTSQIKKPFILDDLSDSDFTIILDNDYDGNSNTATTSDDMAISCSMTTSIDSNAATISTSPSTSPSTSNEPSKKKSFHVHSKILTDNSEYFNALIHSPMIESQNHTLLLKDTSYQTMKTILEFLYTGELSSINKDDGKDDKGDNNMDVSPSSSSSSSKRPLLSPRATTVPTSGVEQWIDLLYVATRFLIKPLIQRCEKELGKFVNMDNANEFELIANECGADQLLTYCKTLDFKSPNYGDDDDYLYATSTSSGDETIYDTEYDDANHNDVEDEEFVAYPE
ncbi:4285_t:CDS:2, partial [Entrophospora sp. SA101]